MKAETVQPATAAVARPSGSVEGGKTMIADPRPACVFISMLVACYQEVIRLRRSSKRTVCPSPMSPPDGGAPWRIQGPPMHALGLCNVIADPAIVAKFRRSANARDRARSPGGSRC